MPPRNRRPSRFGAAVVAFALFIMVAGLLWALVEWRPWKGAPESSSIAGRPSHPKRDEPNRDEDVSAPAEAELRRLFSLVEERLREARYAEAGALLAPMKEIRIGDLALRARLRNEKARIETYRGLLRETRRGGVVSAPTLSRLELADGGAITVRGLEVGTETYSFEDLRGTRAHVPRMKVRKIRVLSNPEASEAIWDKLRNLAAADGIEAFATDEGGRRRYGFRAGSKVSGLAFFDLADFCVSNGWNDLVTRFLDEGLKRDPRLPSAVHEKRADETVDLLFYFLSIPSPGDAEYTLKRVLLPRYGDTRAFRDRVREDSQTRDVIARTIGSWERPPKREAPGPARTPIRRPAVAPTLGPLPAGIPAAVRDSMERGDHSFQAGMAHLLRSDPSGDSDRWSEENRKAIEQFQAARDRYRAAQNAYSGRDQVPQALLDRFRETQVRLSLCRKRSVSRRR